MSKTLDDSPASSPSSSATHSSSKNSDEADNNGQPADNFSPFAGCSIFIVAGAIAVGMIVFLIWSYFQTQDMVEGFTDPHPQTVQVKDLSGKENQLVALKSKLVGFRHNIEAHHRAKISLNAEEMNLAIAAFDLLKPHRNALFIQKISPDGIRAKISFPTRWKMLTDEKRYINATVTILPELVDGAAFPKITQIHTEKGTAIPEEFQQFISKTLLSPLYEDPELGNVFKGLSDISIKKHRLVLHTNPDYKAPANAPENSKSNAELSIDRTLKSFFALAIVFLAIVAIIITLSRRKRAKL